MKRSRGMEIQLGKCVLFPNCSTNPSPISGAKAMPPPRSSLVVARNYSEWYRSGVRETWVRITLTMTQTTTMTIQLALMALSFQAVGSLREHFLCLVACIRDEEREVRISMQRRR
jgi:hypothetical protein